MAFRHEPLTEAQAGPGAWKVARPEAPPPLRGMAAKGLAPLPPRDLLVVLYQLWVLNEPQLAADAAKTVVGLPPPVLFGALGDPGLPPGVLDFVARKFPTNVDALEKVVRHPKVDDESLAGLARICPEEICEILAENQQRWLAFPPIVESLYQNPNCRMSTVHRMLELAVRQGIDVRLPNIEEIKQALGDGVPPDPAGDEAFRAAAAHSVGRTHAKIIERVQSAGADEPLEAIETGSVLDEADEGLDIESLLEQDVSDELELPIAEARLEEAPDEKQPLDPITRITKLRPMQKIRLALLGSAFERSVLIRDRNKAVALSAIKSPKVKETEAVAYAANRTLSHEVVSYLARRREWTKLYAVKLNLVLNPKTPMSAAMGFLGHLHAADVRKVAHSKNIPSALAQAAKRKLDQRR